MIFQFGTVLVLAFATITPLSDDGAFSYKATCSNDSVFTSVYLEATSDDDAYWYTFDLGLTFDFYFNNDDTPDQSKVKNFVYDVSIYRHYTGYNNVLNTYTISVDSSDDWYLFELQDLVHTLHFSMYHENDICIFEVFTSSNARIGLGSTVVLPTSEEFIADYGFTINLDFTPLYNVLRSFRTNYLQNANGYQGGYDTGYTEGYRDGMSVGYDDGVGAGYQTGYSDGITDAQNQDATASLIFTGILEVGLLPINVFLAIFNYEVFGINISGLVASLLTVAVIVIIIRVILAKSGGNGGSKS